MGRLIDADDVKIWLQERIDGYESLHLGGNSRSAELKIIIDELPVRVPTAYDPGKVVKRLEDRKSLMLETLKISEADIDRGRIYGMDKAIEIVKGDGVDGN